MSSALPKQSRSQILNNLNTSFTNVTHGNHLKLYRKIEIGFDS